MATAASDMQMGIPADERSAVARGLSRLLADTYTLYLKTHNYHWNVTGPMFSSLHLMFETEYMELALAVDEIAETIRALGVRTPASYREFSALATITCSGVYRDFTICPGISPSSGGSRSGIATTSAYPPVPSPASSAPTLSSTRSPTRGNPTSAG